MTGDDNTIIVKTQPFAEAMLYQAFLDVYNRDAKIRFEAREWVGTGTLGRITFNWCCECLNLEPSEIRRTVHERIKYNKAVLRHVKGGPAFRSKTERD